MACNIAYACTHQHQLTGIVNILNENLTQYQRTQREFHLALGITIKCMSCEQFLQHPISLP